MLLVEKSDHRHPGCSPAPPAAMPLSREQRDELASCPLM